MSRVKEFIKPMSIGLLEKEKLDTSPCDLSQQFINQCRWKYVEEGICSERRADGSVCNCPVDQHLDDSDWKRFKGYFVKLGNQAQKEKEE